MTEAQQAYRDYLRTPHWRALRWSALHRDGFRCCLCPSRRRLEVHHKTYRYPWTATQLVDLQTLCSKCHCKQHRTTVAPADPVRVKIESMMELNDARARRLIGRDEFLRLRAIFLPPKRRKKRKARRPVQGIKPFYASQMRTTPRWTSQRGNSSN